MRSGSEVAARLLSRVVQNCTEREGTAALSDQSDSVLLIEPLFRCPTKQIPYAHCQISQYTEWPMSNANRKLSQQFIASGLVVPAGKTRIEYVCDQLKNFFVEVRATSQGEGSYYVRYRNKSATKTTRYVKIGRTSQISLTDARAKAKSVIAEIALGADPRTFPAPASSASGGRSCVPAPRLPACPWKR
jgi:Arm DNA-binding domain